MQAVRPNVEGPICWISQSKVKVGDHVKEGEPLLIAVDERQDSPYCVVCAPVTGMVIFMQPVGSVIPLGDNIILFSNSQNIPTSECDRQVKYFESFKQRDLDRGLLVKRTYLARVEKIKKNMKDVKKLIKQVKGNAGILKKTTPSAGSIILAVKRMKRSQRLYMKMRLKMALDVRSAAKLHREKKFSPFINKTFI